MCPRRAIALVLADEGCLFSVIGIFCLPQIRGCLFRRGKVDIKTHPSLKAVALDQTGNDLHVPVEIHLEGGPVPRGRLGVGVGGDVEGQIVGGVLQGEL